MNPFTNVLLGCFALCGTLAASAQVPSAEALSVSSPTEYQVVQRTHRAGGSLPIRGHLARALSAAAEIQCRLPRTPQGNTWVTVAVLPAGETNFQSFFAAPAGGWYPIEIRILQATQTLTTVTRHHVGVGEVFVISGQSNSANHGEEKQKTRTGRVSSFSGRDWRLADDPQPGASGNGGSFLPPLGDALVERFGVPVGIVSCGVGATSIREWLPRGTRFPHPPTLTGNVTQLPSSEWESKGTLFENFTRRIASLGPGGFRAVLWHQGESDANQTDPIRTLPGELYQRFLEQLIRDSSHSIGWQPPWFVALASYHTPEDPGSPDLRAAQRALWTSGLAREGPDSDALTGDLRDGGGKGVHFSGKGLRTHAAQWFEKVAPWLEQQIP